MLSHEVVWFPVRVGLDFARVKRNQTGVTVSMVKLSVGLSLHVIQHLETHTPEYKVLYCKVLNIQAVCLLLHGHKV